MKEPTVPQKPCGLVIENRKKAVLTGVKEVDRFDETAVVLETWGGRLTLTGSGLHVDGDIDGVQYEQGRARRKGGFLRRAIG